jgi:hypothetical protein
LNFLFPDKNQKPAQSVVFCDLIKTPPQGESMVGIRAEIDRLNRQVVVLLGQRFAYVKAVSKLKALGAISQ